MSTIGDKYVLGSGRSDHDRLRVFSEIHDSRTRDLLLQAGVVQGHWFVEFGCGLGYVTQWAAREGAHATGIDLNEDQVAAAGELAREAALTDGAVSACTMFVNSDAVFDIHYVDASGQEIPAEKALVTKKK